MSVPKTVSQEFERNPATLNYWQPETGFAALPLRLSRRLAIRVDRSKFLHKIDTKEGFCK